LGSVDSTEKGKKNAPKKTEQIATRRTQKKGAKKLKDNPERP